MAGSASSRVSRCDETRTMGRHTVGVCGCSAGSAWGGHGGVVAGIGDREFMRFFRPMSPADLQRILEIGGPHPLMLTSRALSQLYEIGLVAFTLNQDAPAFSHSRSAQMNAKWEQGGVTGQLR